MKSDLAFLIVVGGGFLALLGLFVALSLIARVNRVLTQISDRVWR